MHFRSLILRTLAALSLLAAAVFTGCSMIDEDISGCNSVVRLTYQLELDPEIVQELDDELNLHADEEIRTLLKDYIDGVFTNYARDIDLLFYDTDEPMPILRELTEVMNSSSNTYSLSIPVRPYMHTALANVQVSENVKIEGRDSYPTSVLRHEKEGDYYAPQHSGLFWNHHLLDVSGKKNQRFRLRLNMVNSATALVLDMGKATQVQAIRVELKGMSTRFNMVDSTYVFDDDAVYSTEEFITEDGIKHCYASVHFPSRNSREEEATKADDDGNDTEEKEVLWSWVVYATLYDGSITRSILEMSPPVHAGQLKIRNAFVMDEGQVGSNEVDVGVTVELNWDPGPDFIIPM